MAFLMYLHYPLSFSLSSVLWLQKSSLFLKMVNLGMGVLYRMCVCMCSVLSNSMSPHGPARLLCLWEFPSKKIGVGCSFLLQEIFLTQVLNLHCLCLLHWQVNYLPISHLRRIFLNRMLFIKTFPFTFLILACLIPCPELLVCTIS